MKKYGFKGEMQAFIRNFEAKLLVKKYDDIYLVIYFNYKI